MALEGWHKDPILYVSDAKGRGSVDVFVTQFEEVLKLSFNYLRNGLIVRSDDHLNVVRRDSALSEIAFRAAREVLRFSRENP